MGLSKWPSSGVYGESWPLCNSIWDSNTAKNEKWWTEFILKTMALGKGDGRSRCGFNKHSKKVYLFTILYPQDQNPLFLGTGNRARKENVNLLKKLQKNSLLREEESGCGFTKRSDSLEFHEVSRYALSYGQNSKVNGVNWDRLRSTGHPKSPLY